MVSTRDTRLLFDSIEDTIESFSLSPPLERQCPCLTSTLENGNFIVVLDSADRENEGDLIIAAEAMTTEKMAFMVRYTRCDPLLEISAYEENWIVPLTHFRSGLICTPLSPALTKTLSLPQMVNHNTESHQTAYTVSVDASHSAVTTGISAHDRALTCRTLASPSSSPQSFRRPGHVFPLRARAGGVKERNGHTEAAVEFCRLAGMREVGAICELVLDGEESVGVAERKASGMMRRDACLKFGRKWGLRVCTIEDLVEFVDTVESKNGLA